MVYPHTQVRGDMGQGCERCKIMVYPHTQVWGDTGQECERCKIMVYPHTQVRGIWDRCESGVRSWFTHILRYGGYGTGVREV